MYLFSLPFLVTCIVPLQTKFLWVIKESACPFVCLSVQMSCNCTSSFRDKLILMKHYTVAVYNLRIKNEGEKSWSEIVQGRLLAGRGGAFLFLIWLTVLV